jgi:hypothetical protein
MGADLVDDLAALAHRQGDEVCEGSSRDGRPRVERATIARPAHHYKLLIYIIFI